MNDTTALRRALVDQMTLAGHLRTLPWITAFANVPRHLFLPQFFRQTPDHSGWEPVSEQDPGWPEMVYTDATWVTQLDNDPARWQTARSTGRPVTGVPTSSSTAPGLMALMLEALALLRRDGHGQVHGSFLADHGGFMPVRSDPPADAQHRLTDAFTTDDTQTLSRATGVAAEDLDHPDFGMLAALRLPGVTSLWFEPVTGRQRWLLADRSWASVDEGTHTVTQYGPHRLWDTVEALYQQWTDAGKPTRDRFGLSVTTSGTHRFWLDTPETTWWSHPVDAGTRGVA